MKIRKTDPPIHSFTTIEEEDITPRNFNQEIKNTYDFKSTLYTENLVRVYMTPKKLMETRNKSTTPCIINSTRESRNNVMVREIYRPSSNKPPAISNDDKEKKDSLQRMINNIAYS